MNPTQLNIRIEGDPCLRAKSVPVEAVGSAERMLIEAMFETMYQAEGIGLAAPQIGINERFIVIDVNKDPFALFNPEVLERSGPMREMEEGCLSCPKTHIKIMRQEKIIVRYLDINNQVVTEEMVGLLARAVQHEIDHLDGKLIVDYA